MKRISLFIFAFVVLASLHDAYAQSPREQLGQLVQQLQASPNDGALRERIIQLGAEIKPPPAIPEEANRAFVKGGVFQKEAKDTSGYELAISSYRDALRIAPWWGDAYFNLAIALESAGKFDEAIDASKSYLASIPSGNVEARDAQNRIYALEAKSEMAKKQAATAATAAEAQRPTVEGEWDDGTVSFQVVKKTDGGYMLVGGRYGPGTWIASEADISPTRLRFVMTVPEACPPRQCGTFQYDLSLSSDGRQLSGTIFRPRFRDSDAVKFSRD